MQELCEAANKEVGPQEGVRIANFLCSGNYAVSGGLPGCEASPVQPVLLRDNSRDLERDHQCLDSHQLGGNASQCMQDSTSEEDTAMAEHTGERSRRFACAQRWLGCAQALERLAKSFKARKTVRLSVAGAFHTPYMQPAEEQLRRAKSSKFQAPVSCADCTCTKTLPGK